MDNDVSFNPSNALAVWLEGKREALVYACSEKGGKCLCSMCDRERARLQMIEQVIAKLNEFAANNDYSHNHTQNQEEHNDKR